MSTLAERTPGARVAERSSAGVVAGTAAVALLLATGRWGSHVGLGPIYITDVLLAAAFFHAAASWRVAGRWRPPVTVIALLIWAVVRFALSPDPVSQTAVRDFAPYLYALTALLSGGSTVRIDQRGRDRTFTVIWVALLAHAAWVAVAVFFAGYTANLPVINGVRLFETRDDFDGGVLGVLAAMSFLRWGLTSRVRYLVITGGAGFLTLALLSRAGLLALALSMAMATFILWREGSSLSRRRLLLVPAALIAVLALLPSTVAGARLLATVGYTQPEASLAIEHSSAQGTTDARERSWGVLTRWILDDTPRTAIGVGFGPDFLTDSHASYYLLGEAVADERTVRSPHNYYLGSWARLGVVGLALIIVITATGLRSGWRRRRDRDLLTSMCGIIVTATVPVAAFGVTLEAPFGAVPFFWALGVLFLTPADAPRGDATTREDRDVRAPGRSASLS